jgi:hypothetical protein
MATVNTNWTSPASATLDKSTGATIDEAMTDALASNLYHLGGASGHIGCSAYHAATQSVSNATLTTLSLNSERYDSDPNGAIHDTVTNNTRLTCRTAGTYLIVGQVGWAVNATGIRRIQIQANGSFSLAIVSANPVTGESHIMPPVVAVYQLAATEYVELVAYQTSGGALSTIADTYSVSFTMAKL